MTFQNKIKWRLKYLFKLLKILSKEPVGHFRILPFIFADLLPSLAHWRYINLFLYSKEKKIQNLDSDEVILDLKLFKIIVNEAHCNLIIRQFFDLVYPYLVKNPIVTIEGPYERDGVKLKQGDVVIDAGAYLGVFSMLASKKVGPKGKIYAFEPIPENYELLKKTVELNKAKNIEVIPYALGQKEDLLSMGLEERRFNMSSGFFKKGNLNRVVKQISLDEFARQRKILRVDFIKANIEGMERELLAGAKKTIKKFKPCLSICNYHRPDDPRIIRELILNLIPQYKITQTRMRLYAWNPDFSSGQILEK